MPRTRKRKTPAGETEAALLEPAVEKPAGNFIDFQTIIRESQIVFTTSHVVQSVSTSPIVTGCGGGRALGSLPSPTFAAPRTHLEQPVCKFNINVKRFIGVAGLLFWWGDPLPGTKWEHRDKAKGGQVPNSKHQSMGLCFYHFYVFLYCFT
ncbi:hypothetical protein DPMN_122944 [Dreissena polymorpha]|uniref:Uncharacterized protein n=1 Tax=Dreissena polymorpha TaxID=45954 RepID=A0A9D4GQL8_DREPO|nr:hypothetical protein DPMN_122944 [Dreissena polymorpha]